MRKLYDILQNNCYINRYGVEFLDTFNCPSEDNGNGENDRQGYTRIYEDKNRMVLDDDEQTQYLE